MAKKASRVSFLALCIAVTVATGGLLSCHSAAKPPAAPTAAVVKVERRNLTSTLEIASEFLPYQEIDVYAKESGYIQDLRINWGTHVKQGQLMAVLEIPELEQQLRYDEAAIRRSEHEVARTREEQSRMRADYAVAHITYSRIAGVWKTQPGLISQQDLDVVQGKDQASYASVSAAEAAVDAAQQALSAAQATLDRDKALYAYARIIAPFDGVVTQLNAYTGALLPAGTAGSSGNLSLCHLSQNNLLRLVIPVPERSVPDVRIGDTIPVDVTTLNRRFPGKVVRFSDRIDLMTRTMHTEIDVPNPKYVLIPGMYATVEIPVKTVSNSLVIPPESVHSTSETEGSVMVVGKNNTLEPRNIEMGLRTPGGVQVLSGLQENEMVVFGEQSQYKAGEKVTPKLVNPPTAG